MRLLWLTSVCALALLPVQATAADTLSTAASYMASDFVGKPVQSAADALKYIPNFIVTGSGGSSNLLIDGQRPSDTNDALTRLPLNQIERIERIAAGNGNYDMQGHSELINIVRKSMSKPVITIHSSANIYPDGKIKPQVGFTWQKNQNGRNLEAGLSLYQNHDEGTGHGDKYTTYADGTTRHQALDSKGQSEGAEVRAAWGGPASGGRLDVNGAMRYNRSAFDAVYENGVTEYEQRQNANLTQEVSGRYEKALNKRFKLNLNLWGKRNVSDSRTDHQKPDEVSTYSEDKDTREGSLAAQATWHYSKALMLQAGAESRFNRFDAESLSVGSWLDENTSPETGRTRGEEQRGSLYVSGNWRPNETLSIDSGLAVESMTFRHRGTYAAERSYEYPKPRLSLQWKPDKVFQVRLSRAREVGYMGYWDFVSIAEWQYERPDQLLYPLNLVPYRQWSNEFSVDYRFWEKGQLALSFERNDIDDAVERVPLYTQKGNIEDIIGNVGDGANQQISTRLSVPIDDYLENGMIRLNATWYDSEITDPITGLKRRISGQTPRTLSLSFNQDRPGMSWGWSVDSGWNNTSWRAREISQSEGSPWVSLYAEFKPSPKLSVRTELQNLGARTTRYDVTRYEGLRSGSALSYEESTQRDSEPKLYLRIRNEL
ncbi:TonB-dependent receptor plug domain-containing protein [Asticcacaulis sp. W401b]|uniref:TonB-dependent receptor plug domain-containing protein n=1 Tax=Asticcacaulis sp. W401b TaxID=3388666 RepID=UPI003970782B